MASSRRSSPPASCGLKSEAPKWLLYAAFAILAVLAGVLVFAYLTRPTSVIIPKAVQEGFFSSKGDDESKVPSKSGKLVFLHMKGCGWCDRFKPHWEAFEKQYKDEYAKKGLQILDYERSDPDSKPYEDHVGGYPTVLLVTETKGGKEEVVKFEGERTPEGLVAFLKEHGY